MAQNLGKRLVGEIKRGGKKSIALGLLLLVGLYFWVPMVWKRFASSESNQLAAMAKLQSNAATHAVVPSQPSSPVTAAADWKSQRAGLDNSLVVQPLMMDELVRDPFDREWIRHSETVVTKTDIAAIPENDPIKGLVCSSIVVGPNYRAAIIGDKTYRVGEMVPSHGPIQYLLKDVLDDRVLLEREGTVVILRVPQKEGLSQ